MANEGLLIETLESSAIHKYSLRQVIFVHKGLFFLAIINILFPFCMSLKARVIFRILKKIIYGNKWKLFCERVWFTCILCTCLFWFSNMIYFVNMPVFTDSVIVNVEAESFIHQLIHLFSFSFSVLSPSPPFFLLSLFLILSLSFLPSLSSICFRLIPFPLEEILSS